MQKTDTTSLEQIVERLTSELAETSAKVEVLARDNERLAHENTHLIADNSALELKVANLTTALEHEHVEREKLISMIMLANARAYGAHSEKISPYQYSLFNDIEAAYDPDAQEPTAKEVAIPRKQRKRRKCVDWSKYETTIVWHGFEDEIPTCPECGSEMADMGYQVKRVFKIRPAHVYVEEHRQAKLTCRKCAHKNNANGGDTPSSIIRAEMPEVTPVAGSCASASLIAYIMDRKYCMGMPLYRISKDLLQTCGLTITRQALAGWVIKSYQAWLSPIRDHMKTCLIKRSKLHIDETRIQVLKEPNRKPQAMSWAWLFCTTERDGPPIYIFKYDPSRGYDVPNAFLPTDWRGTIITDGWQPYETLTKMRPGIVRVSCLVHILRKYKDVLKGMRAPHSTTERAIAAIDEMFYVDNQFDELPTKERKLKREQELKPLMDKFQMWLDSIVPLEVGNDLLRKAIVYSQNQFPYLYNALSDGDLPIENNAAERALRPLCIGRRGWLFSDTQVGAEASCGIYSIVTTAKGNGLNPMRYLEWLLDILPNTPGIQDATVLERFMPWSADVPAVCKLTPEEATAPDPMDEPLVDIDPTALNEG